MKAYIKDQSIAQLHGILIDCLGMIFRRTWLCSSFFTSKIETLLEGLLKQSFFSCYIVRLSRNQLNFLPRMFVFRATLVPYQNIFCFTYFSWVWKLRLLKLVGVQLPFWHQTSLWFKRWWQALEMIPDLSEPSWDARVHPIFQNFQKARWLSISERNTEVLQAIFYVSPKYFYFGKHKIFRIWFLETTTIPSRVFDAFQ